MVDNFVCSSVAHYVSHLSVIVGVVGWWLEAFGPFPDRVLGVGLQFRYEISFIFK